MYCCGRLPQAANSRPFLLELLLLICRRFLSQLAQLCRNVFLCLADFPQKAIVWYCCIRLTIFGVCLMRGLPWTYQAQGLPDPLHLQLHRIIHALHNPDPPPPIPIPRPPQLPLPPLKLHRPKPITHLPLLRNLFPLLHPLPKRRHHPMDLMPDPAAPAIQHPTLIPLRHGRRAEPRKLHHVARTQVARRLVRRHPHAGLRAPLQPRVEALRVVGDLHRGRHGADARDGAVVEVWGAGPGWARWEVRADEGEWWGVEGAGVVVRAGGWGGDAEEGGGWGRCGFCRVASA